MKDVFYFLCIGCAEFLWSYMADMSMVKMVSRKKWEAVMYDAGALIITYAVLRTIARSDWEIGYICAAIIGAVAGTWVVASRKPKKKKRSTKKVPFMTA